MTVITESTATKVTHQNKIKNLFPRVKPDNKFIDTSQYSDPIFGMVKNWVVTEKIDGMNIRVHANQNGDFLIGGKSDRANLANDLVENIESELLEGWIYDEEDEREDALNDAVLSRLAELGYEGYNVTLFGEGYGPGIQGGDYYRDDKGFILYDARFSKDDGRSFYAPFEDVKAIGEALNISVVRSFELQDANMIYLWMRETVSEYWETEFEEGDGYECEGIVAYPALPLYDSFGERVVFKLKCKDVRKAIEQENG